MGSNWTHRPREACLLPSYTRRGPLEPLKLLSNLPRDVADDVAPHSRVHWSDHPCNADTANIAPGPASQQSERETRRKHKEPKVGDSSQDVSSDVRSCNFYPDQKETTKKTSTASTCWWCPPPKHFPVCYYQAQVQVHTTGGLWRTLWWVLKAAFIWDFEGNLFNVLELDTEVVRLVKFKMFKF